MTERNRTTFGGSFDAIGKILSSSVNAAISLERLPSERDFAEKFDTSRGAFESSAN
jgi:hypothetical protein